MRTAARGFFVLLVVALCGSGRATEKPSVELALRFRPVQPDVEYDKPAANLYGQCRVEVERGKGISGWVVLGPGGQVLRRFVDTNGDNIVDQWRYYREGIEVYRDIDSDFDNKVDQFRWVNLGGSRWAVDEDEDGKIDRWKQLSAEEATRVAVQALVRGDWALFRTLLVTQDDLDRLGVTTAIADQLLKRVRVTDQQLRELVSRSRLLGPGTRWVRFDSVMPSVLPADAGKSAEDLVVYENAMAIVDNNGKTGLVEFGELLRVGRVWKLTQLPKPVEGTAVQVVAAGPLMRAFAGGAAVSALSDLTPEMQRLLDQLQELDRRPPSPSASPQVLGQYVARRTAILSQLVRLSKSDQQREPWLRQLVDGLASAAQTGALPDAVSRLAELEKELRSRSPNSPLLPYVTYRRLMADYSRKMQTAKPAEQVTIQQTWLKELRQFVEQYPKAEDVADAMVQLAVHHEFAGKLDEARKWYRRAAAEHGETEAGQRAAGALRRLDLAGKPLKLSGPGLNGGTVDVERLRGRVVLVFFWATWCTPCTQSLPELRSLYAQYHDRGFEIVGVSLDATPDAARAFVQQQRVAWPQIYQPGGLSSPIARSFGIISLPTLFLVDSNGQVVSSNVSVGELKTRLAELFKR